jgi:hypothetical protein
VEAAGLLHELRDQGDIILYTDASKFGIGGVLMQFREEVEKEVPICFVSKKFSKQAMDWSTIEQECFAVFFSVLRLRSYLLGRRFVIATDHRNLVYLQNSTIPKLVRWRLRLLEFDFVIKHVPGRENVVADALSRVMVIRAEELGLTQLEFLRSLHNNVVGHHGVSRMMMMLQEIEFRGEDLRKSAQYVRR